MLQVLQKFCCRKEACGYAKVIHKKEVFKKMNKCLRYLKQWVLRCLPEKKKREMKKIAHVFMQSCFPSSKREICFQGA
jgi:hypothetical protein